MQRLISFWGRSFFTEPILVLLFVFCFFVGVISPYKDKVRFFFLIYFLSGMILFVPVTLIIVNKFLTEKQTAILQESANTVFELVEFIALYCFFQRCLQNNKLKMILDLFLCFLVVIMTIFFIKLTLPNYAAYDIRVQSLFINVVEFFFLFIMCLAYYREVFTDIPIKNLSKRPSFYIVTSAFFYTILMIPFFLIAHDVHGADMATYNILFACHYLLLMILLMSISKAFLCKIPITI